jgi:3-oxoacyl-[acyl-carrier protein] reductase
MPSARRLSVRGTPVHLLTEGVGPALRFLHGAGGGVDRVTRAVAREVASPGILVNAICPGYIETPMTVPMSPLVRAAVLARTPLGRTGEPREVAQTALFLASDDSAFYTGQWLSPNGGLFIG